MKTKAVILAGGQGSRLGVLTTKRTKPAVPFAGKYRIIDFPLSNCTNSNIFDVMREIEVINKEVHAFTEEKQAELSKFQEDKLKDKFNGMW